MGTSAVTYHIIGGGVAGLSCTWFLKQKNKNIRTIVYEAAPFLGGRAYSYFDEGLDSELDNATHVVIGANKFLSRFIKKNEWEHNLWSINMADDSINKSFFANKDELYKIFGNTSVSETDPLIKKTIFKELFPFTKSKRQIWFSKKDLSQRLINVLSSSADEIKLNCRLEKIVAQFGMAAQLDFGNEQVDIGAHDKVIVALDNASCAKVLNVQPLEHNQIVNIIYHTSQTIFLPKGVSFIGIRNGIADWYFSGGNLLSAIISDYNSSQGKLSDLAVKIWSELDKIRGVNSAFVPPYKAVCCKNATIKQDNKNNRLRPKKATTEYPNVFIAGDWTMQNYPCCMETAVKSAQRAVKTAMKSN